MQIEADTVPIVKRRPFKLRVLIFEMNSDVPIRNLLLNLSHHDNIERKNAWLIRVIMWATLNHKSVEIVNLEDDG